MAKWQTQMADQIQVVVKAYHLEVSLKREALKQYDDLSDQIQDKIIEMVEKETMFNQLHVVFQAKIGETESWKRQSQNLEQQLAEQL